MIYYLEVISDGICLLIDSDVGYYKNLRPGSILEVEFAAYDIKLIHIDEVRLQIVNPIFYIDIEKTETKRLTISSLISLRKMADVTDSINRQKKLEQLGI